MKTLVILGSLCGLGLTIVPSILVFSGVLPWQTHADLMIAGMVLWFITSPLWMKKD
jgi:hypothetical protein